MQQICAKSCHDRFPYYAGQNLKDDDVYDLSATKWDGTTLKFDNFDGYVSVDSIEARNISFVSLVN
jgi:hypothetical protein